MSNGWITKALGRVSTKALEVIAVPRGPARDTKWVELAGWLYAFILEVIDRHRSGAMYGSFDPERVKGTEKHIDEYLEKLPNRLSDTGFDPDVSFSVALEALLAIDVKFRNARPVDGTFEARVALEPPFDGMAVVRVYNDQQWKLARLRIERQEAARTEVKDPKDFRMLPVLLGSLRFSWTGPLRDGSVKVTPVDSDIELPQGEPLRVEHKGIKIALCPLLQDAYPKFDIDTRRRTFTAGPMTNSEQLTTHLNRIIDAARREEVDIVVLPELSADSTAVKHLRSRLYKRSADSSSFPWAVVAGSYHYRVKKKSTTENEAIRYVNRSVMLGSKGDILLKHRKRGMFDIEPRKLNGEWISNKKSDLESLSESKRRVFEGIIAGRELQYIDVPFGRLAILICADAIDEAVIGSFTRNYNRALTAANPDLVFVVMMSDETERFEGWAEIMAKRGISAMLINARSICGLARGEPASGQPEHGGPFLALSSLACFEAKNAPKTQVRWEGLEKASYYDFKQKRWNNLNGLKTDSSGLWLLCESGNTTQESEVLGLVVDLGIHMK